MNEEVHKVMHDVVVERIKKCEDSLENLVQPEDGTLAKIKTGMEARIDKLESKYNWMIIFILTTVVGALTTIVLAKLGLK